jgi:maltose O-acetyltransferase
MPLTPTAKITVGADAFIGAGSVVTEDVPSHVFAPGNPSRIFRPR